MQLSRYDAILSALKPRRSALSAALVDEPGSDGQKKKSSSSINIERSVRDTL